MPRAWGDILVDWDCSGVSELGGVEHALEGGGHACGGAPAVAHGEDHRGGAAHDVAAGIDGGR